VDVHDVAFHFSIAVFVDEPQRLPHHHNLGELKGGPVLADGNGIGAQAEFLSVLGLPVHYEGNREGDSLGAAAFLTTKVQ
jgi:hypothetical protein